MSSQKINKSLRKYECRKDKYSLLQQKKLRNNNNNSYPFFLLFLVVFSSFCFSLPFIGTGGATRPMNNNSFHLTNIVETTFLAQYPPEGFTRSIGFALEDNYLYTIISFNPTILNVSDPSNPTLISEYVYPDGRLSALTLRDDYLYLGSTYGLEILDVSNRTNISKVGEYNMTKPDYVWSIALQDDFAYLAAAGNGLVIVNISNPTQPEEVSCYTTSLRPLDVVVADNYAFIANGNATGYALVILDVSDPQHPTEIGHYEDSVYPEMPGFGLSLNGSYAFLGTDGYGLFILDITDIHNPVKVSQYYGGAESIGGLDNDEMVKDIFIYEQYVFEAAGPNGLYILDVSDLINPILVGGYRRHYAFGVYLQGTYLFLQELFDGLYIFHLTFPSTTGRPVGQIIAMILVPSLGVVIITSIVIIYKRKRYKV